MRKYLGHSRTYFTCKEYGVEKKMVISQVNGTHLYVSFLPRNQRVCYACQFVYEQKLGISHIRNLEIGNYLFCIYLWNFKIYLCPEFASAFIFASHAWLVFQDFLGILKKVLSHFIGKTYSWYLTTLICIEQ